MLNSWLNTGLFRVSEKIWLPRRDHNRLSAVEQEKIKQQAHWIRSAPKIWYYGRSTILTMNTSVVSVLRYGAGIINWNKAELENTAWEKNYLSSIKNVEGDYNSDVEH